MAMQTPDVVPAGNKIVRHALTFTTKPGDEEKVAGILGNYEPPKAQVDKTTRLHRTSILMHGNRVVRAVEVDGDLAAAQRYIAKQPEVRVVEEAINPFLEEPRNLNDPESARAFFMRAALPCVHHTESASSKAPRVLRHGLYFPAKPGCGEALAHSLIQQDEEVVNDPSNPIKSCTVFQRDDIVVRLVEATGPLESAPLQALGLGRLAPRQLTEMLDTNAIGTDGAPADHEVIPLLLKAAGMRLVTDRQPQA